MIVIVYTVLGRLGAAFFLDSGIRASGQLRKMRCNRRGGPEYLKGYFKRIIKPFKMSGADK